MKFRRRLCLLFLLLLTCTMFWAYPTLADDTNQNTQSNTPIGMPEAVKCEELGDEQKKQVAEEAYKNITGAFNSLAKIINRIEHEYSNSSGSCHYLYGSASKWWSEAFTSKLSLSDEVLSGSKKVDEILNKSGSNSAEDLAKKINGDTPVKSTGGREIKMSDYTDWDVNELKKRALEGSAEMSSIVSWAKTAKKGQFMQISGDTRDQICARVQCSKGTVSTNDCDVIVKGDGDSFSCVDTGMGSGTSLPQMTSDGKCYNGYGGTSTDCKANVAQNDVAFTFNNADDFTQKVQNNAQSQKCISALEEINALRGDTSSPNTFIWYRKQAMHAMGMLSGEEKCSCTKDDKGEITARCQDEVDEEDNLGSHCRTIGEYQAELAEKCPTCELLATIAAAAQSISKGSFEALAGDLAKLLGVAFLIYIAYVTLMTVASPEVQKISKYLTTILIQGFKVAITVLILQNPTFLYRQVLGPILNGSVDFSMSLISTTAGGAAAQGGKYASKFDSSNQYLDAKTLQNMVGIADNMNREAAMMPAIGRALICHSTEPKGFWQTLANEFVPFPYQFSMFIEGGILYIFGYMILLALIAYMLDCMVALALVCSIMAFCVACWPFKLTSSYASIGWNMFLNVFFNFVMMGVVVTAIVNISAQSVSGGIPKEEFEALVNGDSVDALSAQMSIGGIQMLVVFVCAMICLKLPKEISRLANKFSGGAQISIGAELASVAAQTATHAAIGNGLQKGKDGKRHLGGAAGLLWKGAKGIGGSVAEHSGLKGAASAAGKAIKGKAQSAVGRIGLGPKAKMGSKGRDTGANSNKGTDNQFKQNR